MFSILIIPICLTIILISVKSHENVVSNISETQSNSSTYNSVYNNSDISKSDVRNTNRNYVFKKQYSDFTEIFPTGNLQDYRPWEKNSMRHEQEDIMSVNPKISSTEDTKNGNHAIHEENVKIYNHSFKNARRLSNRGRFGITTISLGRQIQADEKKVGGVKMSELFNRKIQGLTTILSTYQTASEGSEDWEQQGPELYNISKQDSTTRMPILYKRPKQSLDWKVNELRLHYRGALDRATLPKQETKTDANQNEKEDTQEIPPTSTQEVQVNKNQRSEERRPGYPNHDNQEFTTSPPRKQIQIKLEQDVKEERPKELNYNNQEFNTMLSTKQATTERNQDVKEERPAQKNENQKYNTMSPIKQTQVEQNQEVRVEHLNDNKREYNTMLPTKQATTERNQDIKEERPVQKNENQKYNTMSPIKQTQIEQNQEVRVDHLNDNKREYNAMLPTKQATTERNQDIKEERPVQKHENQKYNTMSPIKQTQIEQSHEVRVDHLNDTKGEYNTMLPTKQAKTEEEMKDVKIREPRTNEFTAVLQTRTEENHDGKNGKAKPFNRRKQGFTTMLPIHTEQYEEEKEESAGPPERGKGGFTTISPTQTERNPDQKEGRTRTNRGKQGFTTLAPTQPTQTERKGGKKDKQSLVDLLVENITLISKHSLADNCGNSSDSLQTPPVIKLINFIATRYLYLCITIIIYDDYYERQYHLINRLMNTYPLTYIHGKVLGNQTLQNPELLDPLDTRCRDFLLLVKDINSAGAILGAHSISRVIILSQASNWRIQEFLSSPLSQNIIHILVIGNNQNSYFQKQEVKKFVMYTHNLFVDGLGSSSLQILTAWRCGALTRPTTNLFPEKLREGFRGHRFVVAAGHQPPFVVNRGRVFDGQRVSTIWDGLEIRLLWLMGEMLDFSFIVKEPPGASFLPEASNLVVKNVLEGLADIGVAGVYVTPSRINELTMSSPHTQDCVTFLTLTSTALPRYRAIMGPFHWTVWLTLTLTYLLAIFPIAFSDSHSLTHLLKNPWQMENMFWYVFGTFTNCFTFKGKHSWTHSEKAATRMLIGWYWVFSIIISACYTGCIIAFVTMPVYPAYVDNVKEVVQQGLHAGTLSDGGWRYWFNDSFDSVTNKLFEKMEYLPDLESAVHNVTTAYYRDYAFLGSWSLLDYTIRMNYSRYHGKRSYMHVGRSCFVPFSVAMIFPPRSPHSNVMSQMLLRIIQSGLIKKLKRDLEWDLRRSATGKLLAASGGPSLRAARAEERKLTLEDVTGMFLLLGAGFGIAALVWTIEVIAWICKKIKQKLFPNENECEDGDNNETDNVENIDDNLNSDIDDTGYPIPTKRRVHSSPSADVRCRPRQVFDEQSIYHLSLDRTNRLRCLVPLQSTDGLPVTSSPKLKRRRMQTPRPSYTFIIEREADDGSYEFSSSSMPQNVDTNSDDVEKYFGARVHRHDCYLTASEDPTSLVSVQYEDNRLRPPQIQHLEERPIIHRPFSF
ncbi:uncharacterized protein Ir21a [Periplaneta americana]|uniref:uncharacterized protein Ir21a n=1 Tax=Periplaneta americana TaxID=6978 RepID=UPI0037E72A97